MVAYEEVIEYDAEPNKEPVNPEDALIEPVTINEPLIIALPVYGNEAPPVPPFKAYEAVSAYEEDPCIDPVNPNVELIEPVTIKLPVITALPDIVG